MLLTPFVQRNVYKGTTPRCWVRLRFAAADGSLHERELIVDTGSPCAVIPSQADLELLLRATAAGVDSNFGHLAGGWLELAMPELGLTHPVPGFGSDRVVEAVRWIVLISRVWSAFPCCGWWSMAAIAPRSGCARLRLLLPERVSDGVGSVLLGRETGNVSGLFSRGDASS